MIFLFGDFMTLLCDLSTFPCHQESCREKSSHPPTRVSDAHRAFYGKPYRPGQSTGDRGGTTATTPVNFPNLGMRKWEHWAVKGLTHGSKPRVFSIENFSQNSWSGIRQCLLCCFWLSLMWAELEEPWLGELPEPSVRGPICFGLGHRLPILPRGSGSRALPTLLGSMVQFEPRD